MKKSVGRVILVLSLAIALFGASSPNPDDHSAQVRQFIQASDQKISSAKVEYQKVSNTNDAMKPLERYEAVVKATLDEGYQDWQNYLSVPSDPAIDLIQDYLGAVADQYMDVAEEFHKQGSDPVALGIAHEIISNYGDLPISNAIGRADDFIFENDPDYRP